MIFALIVGLTLLTLIWMYRKNRLALSLNWMQLPSQHTGLIIVAALFAGALLLRMYHTYDMDPARVWNEEPIWFYILGVAIVLVALSKMSFGWVSTTFKTGNFWMQIITSFLVLTAFFFLLSKVFPDAPLFNTTEGKWHIFWYYVLVGLIALVAANLKGKAWFVNTALVVLMFAMLGHRTAELLDPNGTMFVRFGSRQVASRNPCDRIVRHAHVGTAGSVVNPGGACSVALEVTSGKLFFQGPEGPTEVWWPGKRAIGNVRGRIVMAYAVTPDAELDYLLCPAGMDGTGWYCH